MYFKHKTIYIFYFILKYTLAHLSLSLSHGDPPEEFPGLRPVHEARQHLAIPFIGLLWGGGEGEGDEEEVVVEEMEEVEEKQGESQEEAQEVEEEKCMRP